AMLNLRVKDAADTVAGAYGLPRREIYQMALRLKGEQKAD
ncbi:MAG: 16S rRNA (cytidine1402-2'-O)-methyltransferase, partial [Planktomarina sp.]